MSDERYRDDRRTREGMDEVAKSYLDLAHRAGNTNLTFEQARDRVRSACRRGDQKRDNGNR